MKKRLLLIASMVMTASAADATLVAGWDFSQFYVAGRLSIDGTTTVSSLVANYSSLDPTGNAGTESATYGSLTLGSVVLPAARNVGDYLGTGADSGVPAEEGAVEANVDGPGMTPGTNHFNAFSVLEAEGQANQELLALVAPSATTITFQVEPAQAGLDGSDYSVSFGARARSGGSSSVDVSFAEDCASFGSSTNLVLDETDTAYTVSFPGTTAGIGCVQMALGAEAIVDNVAVDATLPEPGATTGLLAGLLALSGLRRMKKA